MHEVLNVTVKTVNYIKNNALNLMCFAALCERLDPDHLQIICAISWLSTVRVLNHLFELRKEMRIFLEEQHSSLAEHYPDGQF